MGIRLVIEGNSVYEIDEDCLMKKQGAARCQTGGSRQAGEKKREVKKK